MAEMKTLNGYELVDAKARADIEALKDKQPDLTGYATEEYVDQAIDAIPEVDLSGYAKTADIEAKGYLTEHQSLDNYYTKEQTDTAIYNSKDTYYLNFSNATTEAQDAPADIAEFAERLTTGQNVCAHIRTGNNTVYRPASINSITSSGFNIIESDIVPTEVASGGTSSYNAYQVRYGTLSTGARGWKYYFLRTTDIAFATHDYVAQEITKVATGGVDLTNYYTKAEVQDILPVIPKVVSAFINDAEYTTLSVVKQQGYLTQESLDNYYTKKEVDTKVQGVEDIAQMAYHKADTLQTASKEFQTEAQVKALINEALGVIENGTY